MIKHNGSYYTLYTSDGSHILGRHKSLKGAQAQEAAINISKARKAGHKIPKPGNKST